MSLNNTGNNDSIDENLSNNDYNQPSDNNEKDSKENYYEAMEAKLDVEKYVLDKNEIAEYPVYKNKFGDWLVPIFDKNTKKSIGSAYVYVGYGGGHYVMGPQYYSEYKEVISGKSPSNLKSTNSIENLVSLTIILESKTECNSTSECL